MATVGELDKSGIFIFFIPKEDLEFVRMTGFALLWTGVSAQTNTSVTSVEDEVTGLGAGVR